VPVEALSGRPLPAARHATRARFTDPDSGEALDDGLVLWFPAPHSYTGEDVVELQLHGGRAVISGMVEALAARPGLRPAEPGEFTRRAFENGKLDLTAAEGLADLVDAETTAQRRQALRQLGGGLAALYDGWRTRLTDLLAHLEADIDFPDEDLPAGVAARAGPEIASIGAEIEHHLNDDRRGELLRDGFYIAILGPPNAGKSSLLNALARRDAAIVSEIAGTTRDVIEVHLDMAGFPVILADTAGLRDGGETIESEGIRRALMRAAEADLKIILFDVSAPDPLDSNNLALIDEQSLPVWNKIDLIRTADRSNAIAGQPCHELSVLTGQGMPALLTAIETRVRSRLDSGGAPAITRARHRLALEDCLTALRRFADADLPELAAEDIRLAVRALGRITGRVDVEDILDVIFRDFCIGK
jgi:tRNA modification GTPase